MNKAVKSTDPRKKYVMEALKKATGATKITNVREGNAPFEFTGNCFRSIGNRQYEALGNHTVTVTMEPTLAAVPAEEANPAVGE